MAGWVAPVAIGVGSLLGSFFGNKQQSGLQKQDLDRLMSLFSTDSISGDANSLFEAFQRSPMYSGLRNRAMSGSNLMANQLQTSFARRGLSNTGIAGAAMPIARSAHLGKFQDIDMELFAKALQSIMAGRSDQASILKGFPSKSSFGQAFGSTLQSMMPYLMDLMGKKT